MKSWKVHPENSNIAKYVDCYWLLEKTPSDSSPTHPKLNPDPAAHLILSKANQYYKYEQGSRSDTGFGCHLILPYCKTITMDHTQPFLVIGIKFHVGALYSLSLHRNQNRNKMQLDRVVSIDGNELLKSDLDIGSLQMQPPKTCVCTLDEMLMSVILGANEDKHSKLVREVLSIFEDSPISEIGSKVGCSQRTVERSFLRVTGFTLKQYQSMNRLEKLLNYLYELDDKSINWSDIAAQFGFSDQSHLVRYLKNNIGATPGHYARQRDLAIDAYGNFE